MKKLSIILFFIFYFAFGIVFAGDDIKIIPRSEWGADESWRYADSDVWKNYFEILYNQSDKEETPSDIKQKQKNKEINDYLSTNYKDENTLVETIKEENGHQLFWPIQKTNYVKSIVVHHTDSTGTDSLSAIKSIYKYHTLTRGWGDIGYNFLIGYDGEIYEGRAGGDYTVGAHALRNNRSSVGISIIGKYDHEKISDKQYDSLKKLIVYLTKKYGIDINNKVDYHRDCIGNNCDFYLESYKDDAIVGHKDVGHTSCPGEELYKQLQIIKDELKVNTSGFELVKNKVKTSEVVKSDLDKKLDKLSEYELLKLLAQIDYALDKKNNIDLKKLRTKIFSKIYKNNIENSNYVKPQYDKNKIIKVKLSYPDKNNITVKNGNKTYDIKLLSGKLLVNDKVEYDKINIKSLNGGYLEILSWDRIPTWDLEKKYNDNKFKGNLFLYIKNNELVVVNELNLSDYLKGLGEVSDSDNPEKIKTIIVAARTYARWYVEKADKFPGEIYDASDNPDEFQKYLGYSLELRSPNINKIVDETSGQVITYNGDLIKPWYFSQSNGKTLSFKDYCKENNSNCKNINYPYLTAVFDPGSVGKTKLGHGVGISGAGATYLAKKGWTKDMIIKYYLKGVKVKNI